MCHGAAASRGRRRQYSSVLGRPQRTAGKRHCAPEGTRGRRQQARKERPFGEKQNKTKHHEIFIWSRGKKSRGTPRAVTGGHSLAAGVLCGSTKRCGQQRDSPGPRARPTRCPRSVGRLTAGRAELCAAHSVRLQRGEAGLVPSVPPCRAVTGASPRFGSRPVPHRRWLSWLCFPARLQRARS